MYRQILRWVVRGTMMMSASVLLVAADGSTNNTRAVGLSMSEGNDASPSSPKKRSYSAGSLPELTGNQQEPFNLTLWTRLDTLVHKNADMLKQLQQLNTQIAEHKKAYARQFEKIQLYKTNAQPHARSFAAMTKEVAQLKQMLADTRTQFRDMQSQANAMQTELKQLRTAFWARTPPYEQ